MSNPDRYTSPACDFASLGNYSADYSMNVPNVGKTTSGVYTVPAWDAISYDSLTSKVPSCSGYSNITSAYGSGAGACNTKFVKATCGNGSR